MGLAYPITPLGFKWLKGLPYENNQIGIFHQNKAEVKSYNPESIKKSLEWNWFPKVPQSGGPLSFFTTEIIFRGKNGPRMFLFYDDIA